MQRIHQSVQFKPEVLISPSVTPISESGSGMPYRTSKGFDLVLALVKTYYALFYVVFATQLFVHYAVLPEFQRRTYFILNATLRGFKPLMFYAANSRNLERFSVGCLDNWLFPLTASTALAYIPMSEARGFTPISGKVIGMFNRSSVEIAGYILAVETD